MLLTFNISSEILPIHLPLHFFSFCKFHVDMTLFATDIGKRKHSNDVCTSNSLSDKKYYRVYHIAHDKLKRFVN